ncbi:MAG: amidohydrolase family protein [Solobacterium sp.]|nr:amidohydrolase family protein [Solobacterium sp.]
MKYALINGHILDGTQDMEPIEGKNVLINGTRIEAITEELPEGYEPIDLQGRWLMPGLINMHVHLAGNGSTDMRQKDNAALVRRLFSNPITRAVVYRMVAGFAEIELNSGVTTIRTVGGFRDYDTRLRDEIRSGKRSGPRILAGNMAVSVPGGHMAGSLGLEARNPKEAVQFVDDIAAQKPDLIKLMITGGVLDAKEKGTPGEMKMEPAIIRAACEEAHKHGLIVAAHVESTEGVKAALENGVDSIEHGAAPTEETLNLFKERNAFLVTTLSPALPYALFDLSVSGVRDIDQFNGEMVFNGVVDNAKAAIANDIPVALGNDVGCPYITQYDFWRELVYFVKYVGVTNRFALYTATLRNARLAGIGDITGSIEPGKEADLIVTDDNPLSDLTTLRNVRMVMARGRLIQNPKVKRKAEVDARLDPYLI